MAKALLGHIGTVTDRRLLEEIAMLRTQVRLLQSELDLIRAERATHLDLRVPDSPPLRYAEAVPV